jgi:hypothetical protein
VYTSLPKSSVLGLLDARRLPWAATSQYFVDSGGVERGPLTQLLGAKLPSGVTAGPSEKIMRSARPSQLSSP